MPWFKIDDTLHSHPKVRRAGLQALGLWVASGAYCMAYKTDGHVPDWYVDGWPSGKRLADKLVHARLWEVTDDGWQFHDWLDHQPSAAEIEADREHARERQRKRREKLRQSREEGDAA